MSQLPFARRLMNTTPRFRPNLTDAINRARSFGRRVIRGISESRDQTRVVYRIETTTGTILMGWENGRWLAPVVVKEEAKEA